MKTKKIILPKKSINNRANKTKQSLKKNKWIIKKKKKDKTKDIYLRLKKCLIWVLLNLLNWLI